MLGTPAYMAPEQAAGRKRDVGARSDVYSLGALLYELLSGRPPFQGSMATVLHQVLNADPAAPRQFRPGVPADLETICQKAMAKEPGRRYASAGALADDLRRFLEHRPVRARRVGPAGRLALWCRRKPALAATLGLALMTVVAVAGFSYREVLGERDRFRTERDRAQENLYRALVSDAQAQMRSRDTGWWWKALDNLRDAAALDVQTRDPEALRELAIQCLGTPYPCFRLQDTWAGHAGMVYAVAYRADGGLVASAGKDGTVRLWDPATGRAGPVLTGHAGAVYGVAFQPGGRLLVSGGADGTIRLWDLAGLDRAAPGPAVAHDLKGGVVRAVAVSPDGAWCAAACADGRVRVLPLPPAGTAPPADFAPAVRAWAGHTEAVTCLTYSPDGTQLVSGAQDQTVRYCNVPAGTPAEVWPLNNLPTSIAWVGDGHGTDQICVADSETHGVRLRYPGDAATVTGQNHLHSGPVFQVDFDDRRRVLTASADGTLKLWDNRQWTEQAVARGEYPAVFCAAFGPDRHTVAAGYADGAVRLWELAEPPPRAFAGDSPGAVFLGASPRLAGATLLTDLADGLPGTNVNFVNRPVACLAAHPDGRRLALSRAAGVVEVWDGVRRQELTRWTAHAGAVTALAGRLDGRALATAAADGTVRLWDWDTGRLLRTLHPAVGAVDYLAWRPDGTRLAVGGAAGAALLRPGEGTDERLPLPGAGAHAPLAYGADAIAFAAADAVEIVPDGGGPRHTLRGHRGRVTALAFSADGRRLATAATDKTVRLWDAHTGAAQAVLPISGASPVWLAFVGDGHLASGGPWPVQTVLHQLPPRTGWVYADVSAVAGAPLADGSAILLGTPTGAVQLCRTADVDRALAGMGQSASSGTGSPGTLVRIAVRTNVVPGGHTSYVWGVAASPDGRRFATVSEDRTVCLWDGPTGALRRVLIGHTDRVWCAGFSADGRLLASGGSEVKVWDPDDGRVLHTFDDHKALVVSVAFHPSGRWLASAGYDGDVHLRELPSGRDRGVLHHFESQVHQLAFDPSGRWLAAAGHDFRVALWPCGADPPTAGSPARTLAGHAGPVRSVAWSADGRTLAAGSENGTVILWDGATFARVVRLKGGTGQVRGLSFSRDGRYLAAAAYQGRTLIWDFDRLHASLRDLGLDW